MVRVVLVPKNAEGETAADRQIMIDMAIDATGSAVGPFPAFGRVGDYKKPATLYPFTLMMDGRIDYGAYADDKANQNKLQIRSTILVAGAEVAHVGADGTEPFEIVTVTPLTTK
jgi:hypothetical protein